MVIAELGRLNFDIHSDGDGHKSAILVTDSTEEFTLRRLMDEDPQRTVVLLGSAPQREEERVICCGPTPQSSEVRALIKRVASLKARPQA